MNLIERHASKTLKKFAGEFPAVLIIGARQTGKTTILKENKLIQFEINGKTFKIDLIEQRPPKK